MKLKVYKTEKGGHAAMKRRYLDTMNYKVFSYYSQFGRGTGFVVEVEVDNVKDFADVRSYGWIAIGAIYNPRKVQTDAIT